MNKRFSHGKFCGEGKKRKSQMHPASYQEEIANLVEKAQVKNKTKQKKPLKHRGLLHGSAELELTTQEAKKQPFGYSGQEKGNICC